MREQGPGQRWPADNAWTNGGWVQPRAQLLHDLDAYRRGLAEAPVVCKWVGDAPHPRPLSRRDRGDTDVFHPNPNPLPSRERGVPPPGVRPPEGKGSGLTFVASTGDVDRHGDTVSLDGWRLDEYRSNPVVLWAHDYRQPAIGVAQPVWNDGRALVAQVQFAPTAFAREVEGLYRQGFQQAVSVGFRPLRFEERRDLRTGGFLGIQFLEQELLEISAVPVPANSRALLQDGQPHADRGAASVVALLREWRGAVGARQSYAGFPGSADRRDWRR